ncbi:MAG: diadenosine tetraphosphate hydrolase, partial [Lactobacillus sp.]|nr:diadenosine tetraphosphate hydrolase [Lactobacillus sp.]
MEDLDKDCLFCKIIKGEASSYTVFENDDVKAFLDL